MSPMLDVQRRHAEVFRLRMGDKGGKGQPQKLTDAIRATSHSQAVVAAFCAVYGGEPKPWRNGDSDQFEAYLPTTEVAIMVLPGQSIVQWWELYRGSVCERRCDGFTEQLSGTPCACPEDVAVRMGTPAGKACRPMTRINIACPDVDVVGAGSLVSHGMIAAETLPQSFAIAEGALARGLMVPAVLRVVEHKGKRHYVVPQIEIVGLSINALMTGEATAALANGHAKEIAPPAPAAIGSGGGGDAVAPHPRPTPVRSRPARPPAPPLPTDAPAFDQAAFKAAIGALSDPVRDQCKAALAEKGWESCAKIAKANAADEAWTIVRGYQNATGEPSEVPPGAPPAGPPAVPDGQAGEASASEAPSPAAPPDPKVRAAIHAQWAAIRPNRPKVKDTAAVAIDRAERKAVTLYATKRTGSSNEVTQEELPEVLSAFEAFAAGDLVVEAGADQNVVCVTAESAKF